MKRVAALAAVVLVMALAGACSGLGSDGSVEDVSSDSGGATAPESSEELGGDGAGEPADKAASANRTVFSVRSVIRTGEVAVTSKDLDSAREELDVLLTTLGGSVDNEQTEHDEDGRIERSTVVVRVPVDRFAAAMAGIQELGTVKHSDTAAKDVTTQVIDIDERVQTLENSLDRLQDYQRDAADIDDLIRFEQQITQREAELQSLKSQQTYLADQTSMSTISVFLSLPRAYVAPPGAFDDAGFLTGLRAGWAALVDSVAVALAVVGAVLPFAGVLALVGVPAWLLVRRVLRRPAAPAPAAPDAATPAGSPPLD